MADLYMQQARMEADGTLSRAVFTELKKRIPDADRANDLMGTMSAMGMIYFCSIDAGTEALIQRDLRVPSEEAALIVGACKAAVATCLDEPEVVRPDKKLAVMVAQGAQAQRSRAQKSTKIGARAPATKALAQQGTLRVAVHKEPPPKSKPRHSGMVDKEVWESSVNTAIDRMSRKHSISDLDQYYSTMCSLGKSLLIAEVRREAQGLYDYRAGKLLYRANRRAKQQNGGGVHATLNMDW